MEKEIQVFAKWKVKAGAIEEVLALLKEVSEKTRTEKGNLYYNINQSTTDKSMLVLHEAYKSEAAIEVHRNTTHYQELVVGKIISLLEDREVILASAIS